MDSLSIYVQPRRGPGSPPRRRASDIFEVVERLDYVEGFGEIIRLARERMGLTQEELASLVHEKVSIIKKIESGAFRPPLELARSLERVLKVKILMELREEDVHVQPPTTPVRGVTLGDYMYPRRGGDRTE